MEIKISTIKNILVTLGLIAAVSLAAIPVFIKNDSNPESSDTETILLEGDEQILNITARGGYSPREISASANMKTILRVSTKNTFDCSSAFTIPSLNIRKNLPSNGVTEFDLGAQEPGSQIVGTCSMGMYKFTINFN